MLDLRSQRLLVIAPHPDDEVLGCAGLIKKIKDNGGSVYVKFLTVGTTIDYSKKGLSTARERVSEIEKVAKFLNYDDYEIVYPGDDHHLKLDTLSQKELIGALENTTDISLDKIKPTIVAMPQVSDYHQDHRTAAFATIAATRPGLSDIKPRPNIVVGYEHVTNQWSAENIKTPNFFVEMLKEELMIKIQAMKLYKSQIRNGNHQRSSTTIKYLAMLRGAQCGSYSAEAYYGYRFIV